MSEINHFRASSFFAYVGLANLNNLFKLGSSRPLQQDDLGLCEEKDRVDAVLKRFNKSIADRRTARKSLWYSLFDTVGFEQPAMGIFLQAISAGTLFAIHLN